MPFLKKQLPSPARFTLGVLIQELSLPSLFIAKDGRKGPVGCVGSDTFQSVPGGRKIKLIETIGGREGRRGELGAPLDAAKCST